MSNKMLIDATHPEETRVVVLRGNRVEEFDFESASRKQLRGNIYLAKVTRVEPSLQAAFVDYGGNRHGFLAFSEIHPDYYQIPVADRQALLEDEKRSHREDDEESSGGRGERRGGRRGRQRGRGAQRNRSRDVQRSDNVEIHAEGEAPAQAFNEPTFNEAGETIAVQTPEQNEAYERDLGREHESGRDNEHGHEVERPHEQAHDHAQAAAESLTQRSAAHAEPATDEPLPHPVVVQAEEAAREVIEHGDRGEPAGDDLVEAIAEATPQEVASHSDAEEGAERSREADDEDEEDSEAEERESEEDHVESVGGDAIEEVMERAPRYRRHYKIQEVIKRRQVMLVQVVKEERGTKGAALTTYLSLAGRYSVLMPNTARGGGISRKVTNAEDRRHMKEIAEALEVPEGMGVILRTAGAARTNIEIKRDFEYLLRLWETVRDLTLKSTAPTLVYEEGSLIKRAIRDLYHKDIEEIVVEGEGAYREAKDFMRMLMPSAVKNVVSYSDAQPIFTRYGIESQLDAMFQPTVQLKSGGYVVINQTEALVAIDVNSGRATREHSIEETATKTNSEAAAEIARQLRLRDLAGLIVIDFIDMDEGRNNRAVERKMKEALKSDRARIQVGRISHFGLLEMSRQRIRSSVLESSTETCPHCGGTGHVRAVASVALQLVRAVEETLLKGATHNLIVRSRSDVAIYVLNHKRAHLRMLEERFKITIAVNVDTTLTGHPSFAIDRGEQVMSIDQARAVAATIKPDAIAAYEGESPEDMDDEVLDELETEGEDVSTESADGADGQERSEERSGRKRRRRGRRGGRGREGEPREGNGNALGHPQDDAPALADGDEPAEIGDAESLEETENEEASASGDGDRPRRRRGRRGGRRNRRGREGQVEGNGEDGGHEDAPLTASHDEEDEPELVNAQSQVAAEPERLAEPVVAAPPRASEKAPDPVDEAPVRKRSTIREAPPVYSSDQPSTPAPSFVPAEPVTPPSPAPASDEAEAEDKPS
ncbi:MAG: Rne/Rng family ribonuclease [Pseudorhodoplanes sp.]